MTGTTRRFFQRCRFSGIGGALILALWLATAIASPAQTFKTLVNFQGNPNGNPFAGLVQGREGNFYGTTGGTVFKITGEGQVTTLHVFHGPDGADAYAGLDLAIDGDFYGTTYYGGADNSGTVFKITPGGTLTTLYSFPNNCGNGQGPYAGLVQATDGNFYGTTWGCGANGYGTVFKVNPSGALTILYNFCSQANCADGAFPDGSLVQSADGNFYGTTSAGGNNNDLACYTAGCGTVFKITASGALTTLYRFCSKTNCVDGASPLAGLVQAADGDFYGTTPWGGANCVSQGGCGTVFKITPPGELTTLYSFCSLPNCADGAGPRTAPLLQATDGNFYGSTEGGGTNSRACPTGCGTIFQITAAGALTTFHSFDHTDGLQPNGLVQATDGNFYGTTQYGGNSGNKCSVGCGTVFSLSMSLGPFVTFVQASGKVGSKAEILGQGLTGTTAVSFNGTAANFVVHSDTYLTATVPQGATTGFVTVTTPGAVLQSNVKFRVRK